MFDLKLQQQRIGQCVLAQAFPRSVDHRGAQGGIRHTGLCQPIFGIRVLQTLQRVVTSLQIGFPIRVLFPWQTFPGEEDCQQALRLRHDLAHCLVEAVFLPPLAGPALVENAFIFIDQQHEAIFRMS